MVWVGSLLEPSIIRILPVRSRATWMGWTGASNDIVDHSPVTLSCAPAGVAESVGPTRTANTTALMPRGAMNLMRSRPVSAVKKQLPQYHDRPTDCNECRELRGLCWRNLYRLTTSGELVCPF